MLPHNHPDRIRIAFDDRRLVANAGLLLPATLAQHLGRTVALPRPSPFVPTPRPHRIGGFEPRLPTRVAALRTEPIRLRNSKPQVQLDGAVMLITSPGFGSI